jgi:cytochrome c-type biogenesis protein CcmH
VTSAPSRRRRAFIAAFLSLAPALVLAATPAVAQEPAPPADPSSVIGPPSGRPLSGAALDARTEDVAGLLRCPVCQGLSVADSPATMAVNMKAQVKDLLARGYEQEQILAYFERSYGEFVRLRPPLRGVNWLVWLGPIAALGVGAWAVRRAFGARRAPADEKASPPPGPDTLPEDEELARFVLRVREQAYGWPGGRSPGSAS